MVSWLVFINPNPPGYFGEEPSWIRQNPTPCINTTTQLLDLAGIGTPGPTQSVPVRAIQYWIYQNTTNPAVGVWWIWGLFGLMLSTIFYLAALMELLPGLLTEWFISCHIVKCYTKFTICYWKFTICYWKFTICYSKFTFKISITFNDICPKIMLCTIFGIKIVPCIIYQSHSCSVCLHAVQTDISSSRSV